VATKIAAGFAVERLAQRCILFPFVIKPMRELSGAQHAPFVLSLFQAIAKQKRHTLRQLLGASKRHPTAKQHGMQPAQFAQMGEPSFACVAQVNPRTALAS
jgi:hypothetical protein